MTQAPTPISAASTAGKGAASPRHSLGAVSGATTQAKRVRAYIAEHYPNGFKRGDKIAIARELGVTPSTVSHSVHYALKPKPEKVVRVRPPSRRTLILDYIDRVFPCGAIPHGAITEIAEVFGVTRQRAHQIVSESHIPRVARTKKVRLCVDCNAPADKGAQRCGDHRTVVLSCGYCDKHFEIPHAELRNRLEGKGGRRHAQFYCSRQCYGHVFGEQHGWGSERRKLRKSLPPASATSSTTLTPSSEPAPVQAGSSGTPASTSGAQP